MEEIAEIKTYAKKEAVPIIKDETQQFICERIEEIAKIKPQVHVLEIGSAIGYSAIQFARTAENVFVTTIEIDIDRHLKAQQNVSDSGLKDRITTIYGDALVTQIDGQFDVIFIDAAKAQYIKFFEKYKENLADGGIIISDNLSFHGMVEDLSLTNNYSTKKLVKKIQKYIEFLKTNPDFTTEFFKCGDGISVSKRV